MSKINEIEESIGFKVNERAINFTIGFIGLLLIIIGVLGGTWFGEDTKTIIVSVGASLVASSVVTYLSSIYVFKRKQGKELTDVWGLVSIHETRSDMNVSCEKHLETTRKHLDIIAFGLRSLRDARGRLIETKVKEGLQIKILTIDPNSMFLEQREIDEKQVKGSIANSIIQLTNWVNKLKELSPHPDNVQIKYYDALPLDLYYREDNYLYVGPYLYGKDSQQTITMEYRGRSKGFEYYTQYFEDLWDNDEFSYFPINESEQDV